MTLHWQGTGIEVHKVVVGPYENNVFTIRCTETGDAVLIDAANRARTEGHSAWAAIIHAGTRRFRPILLTSLTTFFGLMPMIFETSMQARFLIPMAISLGFGVLFATVIALLIVPALYLIVEDGLRLVGMNSQPERTEDEDDVLDADLVPAR